MLNKVISVEEAKNRLFESISNLESEKIHIKNAVSRVLSWDIYAKENVPPFDRSPLDGYAIRKSDTDLAAENKLVKLKVLEEIAAGHVATQKVIEQTTIKVMTGAPIPEGADAVVKFEDVVREKDHILIDREITRTNIIKVGADVRIGENLGEKGQTITPTLLGLLASCGCEEVSAFRKVKITIIGTGDELIDVSDSLAPDKIRNSNVYSLQGFCEELGVTPGVINHVCDKKEEVANEIIKGLNVADLIITTGGVSNGDYDVINDALVEVGATLLFWGVDVKPGLPTLAAVKDGKLIIGLSGSPGSSHAMFQVLVRPVIKKMLGFNHYENQYIDAYLLDDIKKAVKRRCFMNGKLVIKDGKVCVSVGNKDRNSMLQSLAASDVYIDIPDGSGPLKQGEKVKVVLLNNFI